MPEKEIKENTREARETRESKDSKWHEWTTNVLSQLVDLNSRYENLSKQILAKHEYLDKEIQEKFTTLSERIDHHSKSISGAGDPSKGLLIRVDRLEQSEARRSWWLKSTIAACVGAIITAIFALVKKHP